MSKINISHTNIKKYFYLQPLSEKSSLQSFECSVTEYSDYLLKDAI